MDKRIELREAGRKPPPLCSSRMGSAVARVSFENSLPGQNTRKRSTFARPRPRERKMSPSKEALAVGLRRWETHGGGASSGGLGASGIKGPSEAVGDAAVADLRGEGARPQTPTPRPCGESSVLAKPKTVYPIDRQKQNNCDRQEGRRNQMWSRSRG